MTKVRAQGYVEGVYAKYKNEISTKFDPSTPFPANSHLSKHNFVSDQEAKEITDKGYMNIVGSLLWAAREGLP